MKIPNDLVGIAGVHFVAMELTLRGLIALPTIRNTAGVDVVVSKPDWSRSAHLQVKTSMSKVNFWPTSKPDRLVGGDGNWFVFLRRVRNSGPFEAFLVPAKDVHRQVTANVADHRKRGRKEFGYWQLPTDEGDVDALRQAWATWQL